MTSCFVIGPIGDKLAALGSEARTIYEDALEVYENVIQPACAINALKPVRADQIARSGEITEQVYRHLFEDEVVIADVSGGNANVMYELGLRHTRNLLTVTIGEYGQLPFDISAIRSIIFSRSERGLIDARKHLEAALRVGLAEGSDPVTATRIWLSLDPPAEESDADSPTDFDHDQIDLVDEDEQGFLERLSTVEDSFPKMTSNVSDITDSLDQLASVANSMSAEVEVSSSTKPTAKSRIQLAVRWASQLQGPADELSAAVSSFCSTMSDVDSGVLGILDYIERYSSVTERSETREFLESVVSMAEAARDGMEGLNSFGAIVGDLGDISRVLRRPGKQMEASIREMARAMAMVDRWEVRADKVLSQLGS